MSLLRGTAGALCLVVVLSTQVGAQTVGIGNITDGFDQTSASFEFYQPVEEVARRA